VGAGSAPALLRTRLDTTPSRTRAMAGDGGPHRRPARRSGGPMVGRRHRGLLAWAYDQNLTMIPGSQAAVGSRPAESLLRNLSERRASPRWQHTWAGGTDPLHLVSHAQSPLKPAEAPTVTHNDSDHSPRSALLHESYPGWYRSLQETESLAEPHQSGRSRKVDVVIRRIGWLGTYRQSRETGLWFRGRHRLHQLGYE